MTQKLGIVLLVPFDRVLVSATTVQGKRRSETCAVMASDSWNLDEIKKPEKEEVDAANSAMDAWDNRQGDEHFEEFQTLVRKPQKMFEEVNYLLVTFRSLIPDEPAREFA